MTAHESSVDTEFRPAVMDAIASILAGLLDRSEPITDDMKLMDELGVSSSLALELLLRLEERLQIQINVELMNQDRMETAGDLATFIAGNYRPA